MSKHTRWAVAALLLLLATLGGCADSGAGDLSPARDGGVWPNVPPTVSVGPDQTLSLPATSTSFTAVASDGDGQIARYAWSQVYGSAAVLLGQDTTTLGVSALVVGSYVFRVTVTDDGGATAAADVGLAVGPGGKFYYVSSTLGDDAHTAAEAESSTTPWRSLDKANAMFGSLAPGDSLLFRRGDVFAGGIALATSGTAALPIVVGAYGTGERPILTGLTTLTGFTAIADRPGVYAAACAGCGAALNMVAVDGALETMGRTPNAGDPQDGYLTYDAVVGPAADPSSGYYTTPPTVPTAITDNELPASPDWTGAELVVRKIDYVIQRRRIVSHMGGTLTYTEGTTGGFFKGVPGYGYFIQNDVRTLDQPGEWFYDRAAHQVDVCFGGAGPTSHTIEASSVDVLIGGTDRSHLVIDGLALVGANIFAVTLSGGTDVTVKNVDIRLTGITAIELSGTSGFTLASSTITDTNNSAVVGRNVPDTRLEDNIITNTGIHAGAGRESDGNHSGINFSESGYAPQNIVVRRNTIQNTGYNGIHFFSSGVTVQNNFVTRFNLIEDDGGGIYTWRGSQNDPAYTSNKILGNIVTEGIGAPIGKNVGSRLSSCIYLDGNTENVEVTGNSTANCAASGYLNNNNKHVVVTLNTFFGDGSSLVSLNSPTSWGPPIRDLTMKRNLFVGRTADQLLYEVYTDNDDISQFGVFDENYYMRPIDDDLVFHVTLGGTVSKTFSLASWKLAYGLDASSVRSPVVVGRYTLLGLASTDLASNGDFASGLAGWVSWSEGNNHMAAWDGTGKISGAGSLKLDFTPSVSWYGYELNYSAVGPIASTKSYLLRFSTYGTTPYGIVAGTLRQTNDPYADLAPSQHRGFGVGRTDHELLLPAPTADPAGSINIAVNDNSGTTWLDAIQLYEATATLNDPATFLRFEYNATSATRTLVMGVAVKALSSNGTSIDAVDVAAGDSVAIAPYGSVVLIRR